MDAERHGTDPEGARRAAVVLGAGLRRGGLFLALLAPLYYVPNLYGAELLQAAWVSAWALTAAFGAWWAEGGAAIAGPERRPIGRHGGAVPHRSGGVGELGDERARRGVAVRQGRQLTGR